MNTSSSRAPWTRIRQICLAAPQLEPAVQALQRTLGLQVAYRDPAVGKYGLENAVLPIGPGQFLEVVAPTRPDTAVGRFLARAASPDQLGAYMLICDCEDPAAARARADSLGIRVVNDYQYPDYHGVQLHPRDTGAVMIEFNATPGGEPLSGPYHPAGHDWQAAVTTASGGITAVRVQASDPAAMAQRWAALFGQPAQADAAGGFVIALALGRIEIGPLLGGTQDRLSEIVLSHAPANHGAAQTLCGLRVSV
ncbi:hypothetical protein CCO03_01900 [Comamonas serinivorans]|uniref:VOC domain-containing protein n=1 Tax=Comamonas serinivorans TaxID=1082851 RepID=A0A1Y0EIY3_9BURK|nr:VOC family protein [Comamonas serinivorans]ARU03604.1 hypothetical protein CCO03_01900 [Comamonas serinivorans]